jgi:hypothetical protein
VNNGAAMDVTRMIGWRIRNAPDKPLRVIAGLGRSTLHRIEHRQRDVTRSEIVALSSALEIASSKLIILPILAHTNEHTDAAKRALRPDP